MTFQKRTLQCYEHFLSILEKIISVFLIISLTLMVLCVIIGVIFRNISYSLTWINELAQFCCIWSIYIGLGLGIKYKLLAGVDIIGTLLPPKGKKVLMVLQNLLIMFFLAVFVISSRPLLNLLYTSGRLSPEMRVPIIYGYLGPVLGSSFAFLFAIDVFIRDLIGKREVT